MLKFWLLNFLCLFQTIKCFKYENNTKTGQNIDRINLSPQIIQDATLLTPELIRTYGYPAEVYHITTDDGYILEIHRIPNENGQPVFLQHGLLDSSATWILMGPNNGLAYLLYELGYDVWMGNVRGNRYSKNHTTLSTDSKEFWDFSWHEIGIFDIPAITDFIINTTKFERINYIGHSQGTTAFWVMCSERPEYNNKFILMQALAPVAYLSSVKSPFLLAMVMGQNTIHYIIRSMFGANQFLPNNWFLSRSGQFLCHDEAVTQVICTNALFFISGYNTDQLNTTMLPVIIGHTPAGASVKQMAHYGQVARSGEFRKYDYGILKNFFKYGNYKPPNYDLSKINTPIIFYYSENDWIADPIDIEKLYKKIPNGKGNYLVSTKFNHLDFLWGIDVKTLVYEQLVNNLNLL